VRLVPHCLVAAALLGACSVPRDGQARRIASTAIPKFLQEPTLQRQIFLIRGERFTPVKKVVPLTVALDATVRDLLSELHRPLSAEETKAFYRSQAAQPDYNVKLKTVQGNLVTLDISEALSIEDDPYALGQIVLTITDVVGLDRVDFERNGQRLPQVRKGYQIDDPFVTTPVRKEAFLQPVSVIVDKLFFVVNGKLRVFDVESDGGDPADSPLFTAQQMLDNLSNPAKVPEGTKTLISGLGATISEDTANGFILSFGPAFNALPTADQALAIGQIVESLNLAAQIPKLPTMVLVVAGKTIGVLDPETYRHLVDSVVTDTPVAAGVDATV
jgi:hypothetical protein